MLVSEDSVRVPPGELKAFLCALFEKTGMIPRDADFSSEALVSTSLWGVDSHGVQRAPVYLTRLAEGVIKANPAVTVLSGSLGLRTRWRRWTGITAMVQSSLEKQWRRLSPWRKTST